MTHEELLALPECGGFSIEPIHGMPGMMRAVARENFALAEADVYTDRHGKMWLVGLANGTQYKRLMSPSP